MKCEISTQKPRGSARITRLPQLLPPPSVPTALSGKWSTTRATRPLTGASTGMR